MSAPYPRLAIDAADGDRLHALDVGGTAVAVRQRLLAGTPGYAVLALDVETPDEVRFALDLLVPAACTNACLVLNGEVLLDWFSDAIPDAAPPELRAPKPACGCADCAAAGMPSRFSPLLPGRVQALVLRFRPGDAIRLHLAGGPFAG